MYQIPDDLRARIATAERAGYRIQLQPERTGREADSQWRPRALVWISQPGGVEIAQPLSSEQNLVFATREEANAHMLELALRWIENDQAKPKRRVVAQKTQGKFVYQAIIYREGDQYGWRVDKMLGMPGFRPGETPAAGTAPTVEEAEQRAQTALTDILGREQP